MGHDDKHVSKHEKGGEDEIDIINLKYTGNAKDWLALLQDGAGGVSFHAPIQKISQATEPTLDASQLAIWIDTDDSDRNWLLYNDGTNQTKVELASHSRFHANEHVDGTDDIQDASDSVKGLLNAISQNIGGIKTFFARPIFSQGISINTDYPLYLDTARSRYILFNSSGFIQMVGNGNPFRFSDNITFAGAQTVDGRDVSVDGSKLDGIAPGANVTGDNEAGSVEGTNVKSTGETGGTKFLGEEGDGTCSWKTPSASDPTKVPLALFDANTILKADSDDTPAALTVAEQRLVGRITSGVITDLTAAQVKTLLAILHSDLGSVTSDQHHAKSHNHDVASGAGAIATDQVSKFGDGGTTDYLQIGTNGLITLFGAARVQRCVQFFPYNIGGIAGTYNSIACLAAGLGTLNGMYFKTFDDGSGAGQAEASNIMLTLSGDYVDGTDIEISFSMLVGTTSTNDVRWQAGMAKITEGEAFDDAAYSWATPQNIAGPGTAWERKDVTFTLDGSGLVKDDVISLIVFRDADNVADDYVGDAYLSTEIIKYLVNKIGE